MGPLVILLRPGRVDPHCFPASGQSQNRVHGTTISRPRLAQAHCCIKLRLASDAPSTPVAKRRNLNTVDKAEEFLAKYAQELGEPKEINVRLEEQEEKSQRQEEEGEEEEEESTEETEDEEEETDSNQEEEQGKTEEGKQDEDDEGCPTIDDTKFL
ncbi:hypothetical protein lerEdw1_000078 [Lerista edwardsae]|nr:hypothetical protein lerEdw1_000078 [Lerista edwardsae]